MTGVGGVEGAVVGETGPVHGRTASADRPMSQGYLAPIPRRILRT